MRIGFKGDYALKILLELSLGDRGRLVRIQEIARRQDIPRKFLEQIVLILKGGGYVTSVRGPRGGIALARDPEAITLGEIIRLMEGTTSPIGCLNEEGRGMCGFESRCAFREVFLEVSRRIDEVVDGTTLADMAARTEAMTKKETIDYAI